MIIIIFSLILLLLAYFLYVQKKKVISLQQQISDLRSKISILEKQDLAAEQYNDSLRQKANTVHLYAALSLEETRKASIKEKQSQIVRSSEHIGINTCNFQGSFEPIFSTQFFILHLTLPRSGSLGL